MINGFSKLTKEQKREWLQKTYLKTSEDVFQKYDNSDFHLQQLHDEFIENTIANYYLPMGVAPNFLINNRFYTIPMVIEESSVVAAVSKAAKYWAERGGFHFKILSTEKIGQVHFFFDGNPTELYDFFEKIKPKFFEEATSITANMERRGGGILAIELRDKTYELTNYYQLHVVFNTLDAMGANFINSCLEQIAKTLQQQFVIHRLEGNLDVLMSILSNYVPQCLVKCEVSCPLEKLNYENIDGKIFANRIIKAINVANAEVHRAVTHNKGVMNGIDAVIIATGNDFRAVEAGVHAYACRSGRYQSLTYGHIEDDIFYFGIEVPLAIGTVGGLTKLHPMVKTALQILENPSAQELMGIVASVGLAQNFAAMSSLVTSGIQKGHMKMHLLNILNQLGANQEQKSRIIEYFKDKIVSYNEVVKQFEKKS